ncbi:MAG: hypothetical protein ACI4C1_09930 [Lachnospiraceae bacterium]
MEIKMAGKRRKDRPEEIIIFVLSISIRVMLLILLVLLLYIGIVRCYQFGELVFTDAPLNENSQDSYVIDLSGDESILTIGTTLKKYGIIENEYAFFVQSWIFGDNIQPGEYVVGAYMSSRDIIEMINGNAEDNEN